ncbi:hypothetical protein J1N35_022721 [Gossypium stocksii]|uniref:Uncharacterized protein n=1 Tax=Gossypium stocksii TaxID=47602 RepID=A0A9D4A379_9ROSI|nr:hypothetical protein J1N35_022721 [Gossypium stocksii]
MVVAGLVLVPALSPCTTTFPVFLAVGNSLSMMVLAIIVLLFRYQSLPIVMANEDVATRMQKDIRSLQHELTQLQVEFSQLDTKIDARLKDFHESVKSEVCSKLCSEFCSLFEEYFGQPATTVVLVSNKGKGILGGTPS